MSRVLFLGSKRVGLRCLEAMLDAIPGAVTAAITLDDRDDVRTVHEEFLQLSDRRSVPMHVVSRRTEVPPLVQRYAPDLCVVVGWYWLIPPAMIESVPMGFVGIHFSLLPLYRGSSPLVWALINGELETGVSLFSLVQDVDAGDIWGQRRIAIAPDEYVGTVLGRLEEEAVSLLAERLPGMLSGDVKPKPQNHALATFCAVRRPEDGLIDWQWPADRIARFVRAQSRPYPGAFTYAGTEKVTIWRAHPGPGHGGAPGTIVSPDGIASVVCGDEMLLVIEEAQRGTRTARLDAVLEDSTRRLGEAGAPNA